MSELLTAPPAALRPAPFQTLHAPFIAIVVPALDEEDYIEACLRSLLTQWPASASEILVMDGGSTDRTREIVAEMAAVHPQIRLLHNPRRLQSAAMNQAARLASPRATILVRADAHAHYPAGFVRRCVAELLRTGATSVVVPMRTESEPGRGMQRAIAAAQSSRLGNGGSAHRAGCVSGFVDHGHHAAFDRAFFVLIGGYDESFSHNEDAELDHRAGLAGGRIWMCAEAPVTYFPRKQLDALGRQYRRHGHGRARTLMKHGIRPRPRQVAPLVALAGSAGAAALAPVEPAIASLALLYPLLCLLWGAFQALRRWDAWLLAAGPALLTMHLGWAIGFLQAAFSARRPWPGVLRARTAGS
jgi:succinoglycan biosynthesis protein ExoA